MAKSPSKETWQSRLLAPRLPWGGAPLRPAEVGEGLCAMMVARENVLEDANYQKTVPNRYIVEVAQAAYQRNFQPLEDQIIQQWIDRIKNHLLTTNSRQGRQDYRFAGPVQVEIRPVSDLRSDQVRILCRVQATRPGSQVIGQTELPAYLEAVQSEQRWTLRPGIVTIGRDAGCNIHLDMPAVQEVKLVSKHHAYLHCQEGRYRLFDGTPGGSPSLNGTFVNLNRVPLGGIELHHGDFILLAALDPNHPSPEIRGVAVLRFLLDRA